MQALQERHRGGDLTCYGVQKWLLIHFLNKLGEHFRHLGGIREPFFWFVATHDYQNEQVGSFVNVKITKLMYF